MNKPNTGDSTPPDPDIAQDTMNQPRDGDFADDGEAKAKAAATESHRGPVKEIAEDMVEEIIAEEAAATAAAAQKQAEADGMPDPGVAALLKNLEEQNLRLRAEFANYKKRIEREQIELAEYLKKNILMEFLPVLDDFKMMLDKSEGEASGQSLLEGARIIYENFQKILEKEGVQKIDALGQPFDPLLHEAVMMKQIEADDDNEKVIEVFLDGFTLNNKLLRPSKVVIGRLAN